MVVDIGVVDAAVVVVSGDEVGLGVCTRGVVVRSVVDCAAVVGAVFCSVVVGSVA